MHPTDNHRNKGFWLHYVDLRNVRGYAWNYKRIYRIYWDLKLDLRIKPRKRLIRQAPQPLTAPSHANQVMVNGIYE